MWITDQAEIDSGWKTGNLPITNESQPASSPTSGSQELQERAARGWHYITRLQVTLARTVADRGIRTGSPFTDYDIEATRWPN